MIKSIKKETYDEEKNIINYTLGIKTIDMDDGTQIDSENMVESIVKYSLKNCQEFIQPKWLSTSVGESADDFNFLKIHHYPIGGYDANLYLFYSIFYNHAVISAYYTATHLCNETQSLYSAFKAKYGDVDQSFRYKQYKSFFDKKDSSYLSSLLKKIPFAQNSDKNIISAYADFAIDLISNASHFSMSKINAFIKDCNWSKTVNLNSALISFGQSHFFNSDSIIEDNDSEYILSVYEFERYFNIDYIQFATQSYMSILQKDFHFKQKGELFNRLYALGSMLPNVYSRKCVMSNLLSVLNINSFNTTDENPEIVASIVKSKSDEALSSEWLERAKKFLTHLVYIAFPLIEKTVFINLYEYFKLQFKEEQGVINEMKKQLKSYIDANAKILYYDFFLKDGIIKKNEKIEIDKTDKKGKKYEENKELLLFKNLTSLPRNYQISDKLFDINPIINNLKMGKKTMKKIGFGVSIPLKNLPRIFENAFETKVFADKISMAEKSELILLYRHLIKNIYNPDNLNQYNRQFSLNYFSHDSIAHSLQRLIVDTFMDKSII